MKASQKSTGKPRLSGSTSLSQQSKKHRSSKIVQEKQGPIDWSSRGLKSKYRGEAEREAAWKLWLSASHYAQKTLSENDFVIPTVKVERHPFYMSYYKHLEKENAMSSTRTKTRLLMRRFVFDVQEIWLTNLEHLREHNVAHMFNDPDAENEMELKRQTNEKEDVNRGNGLHNRRDVRALESMESQIQSVSQKRAFANAYHTARLPNIKVVLDYEPKPTPHLQNIKCLPPTIEPLVRGLRISPPALDGRESSVGPNAPPPVLYSNACFPSLVYVLHIDRLLPSSDYLQQEVMGEVLWRFSLYRNDNSSAVQYYISREAEVAEFASTIILSKTQLQQNQHNSTQASILDLPSHLLCSGLVHSSPEPVLLPCVEATYTSSSGAGAGAAWASTKEAVASISVAVLGMSRPPSSLQQGAEDLYFDCVNDLASLQEHRSEILSVKIEVCVTLLASTTDGRTMNEKEFLLDGENRKVYLECSPAELRYLLRESPAAAEAPLGGGAGMDWWTTTERGGDLWPLLAQHLILECSQGGDNGVQYALGFTNTAEQRHERGSQGSGVARVCPEQVAGALSTLEALSCAYELLDVVRLVECQPAPDSTVPIHTLHLEGIMPSFFSHIELPRQAPPLSLEADKGSTEESVSPIPPPTPLLYFNNQLSVAAGERLPSSGSGGSRANTPQKGSSTAGPSASAGASAHPTRHPQQHEHGHGHKHKKRVMAAVNDLLRVQVQTGLWEAVEDSACNLSMIVSGALPSVTQVPGACEYGRRGIWFADHNTAPVEYTQAAARFFREQRATSSQSILVNMTFALDTSLLFDPVIAWEAFSSYPAPTPAEEVDGVIPVLTAPPTTLRSEALASPIEERLSAPVMIFASIPVEGVDFMPLDTPTLPKGFRRHVPMKNRYGYREQIEVTLLGVDPVLATVVFGITRTGAVPNNVGVNNRNIWHNTLAITEHINRPRAPKDYHYILIRGEHSGNNEPTRYTTRMRGDKMVGLTSSAFSSFEDNYQAIQQLRDVFNKQVALDAKIEKVENEIFVKRALEKVHFQGQLQRALEKKMRKATKSELGWRSRFKMSTLLEVQGNWERRRDDRTGMSFFHNIQQGGDGDGYYDQQQQQQQQKEQFMLTCQWEVPAQWDGDPLSTDISGGRQYAQNLYPGHNTKHKGEQAYNQRRAGGGGGGGGNASFGSLSGADYMSEIHEAELDPFDMAPARWDPHPPQHKQQAPTALKLPTTAKGAFEQPPDTWMPTNALMDGGGSAGDVGSLAPTVDSSPNRTRPPRGAKSTHSDASAVDSVRANRSLTESAAPTIDTANLEHIAEQLVSSDELMRVIARRLGLPESQVVPADELSSVFSASSAGRSSQDKDNDALMAPRDPWVDTLDEPEFDSDDDLWSDDEHEVGDFDEEKEIGAPEDMPGTQLEAAQMRRRELRAIRGDRTAVVSVPSQIPALDLRHMAKPLKAGEVDIEGDVAQDMTREEVFGWRRLPRPVIRPGFLSDALLTHTKPPDATSSNTLNAPVFLMPISPVDACKYFPEEFTTAIESIFVPDAKKDMERSIATVERNIRREEELTRNLPTDDLLLFGEATEFTSADAFLARQRKEDVDQVRDPAEEGREKAILAAKSSNIAMMEDSLAMDADPNTTDEFGNTLLILAAQQGAKRMCKFLLRKGANINKQSIAGNTPLHYCYAYGNNALGEYLKAKGADDSIVNVDKLTCYEGLSMDSMKEFYGDDEEAHMVMGPPEGQGGDGEDSD